MSERRRRLALLAVLLVILAWVAWGALVGGGGEAGGPVSALRAARGGGQAAQDPGRVEIVELRLSDLERKPAEFSPGRDPFRFGPAPVPQQQPRQRRPQRRRRQPPKNTAPQQASGPPVRRPPPVDFVFLGSFGPEQRKIAVFSDQSDIFNVLEGDVLKDEFVVRKIGYESADVGFLEFPDVPPQRLAAGG